MRVLAYSYYDPYLNKQVSREQWPEDVQKVYIDWGERNQLKQLIEECQDDQPRRLLLKSLEELGDSLTQVCDLLNHLEKLGVQVIALEQNYNSSDFQKITPIQVKEHLSKILPTLSRNLECRRLRQAHARNRVKCLPPPGKAPYGYRRGQERYIIDRSTAPLVRDFFERFLLYGSLRGAVRYLEKRYGKKIAVSTGRNWLTSPIYRGDLVYKNQEIIRNTHAGILSRSEAAQIDRLLRRNASLPGRTASASRSLAGLVVCQECQSQLTVASVKKNNQEYLYLRPLNCQRMPKCSGIPYHQVLQATIEAICANLPRVVAQQSTEGIQAKKTALEAQIAQNKEIIEQVTQLETQGILDETTAKLRIYQLNTEIAYTQGDIEQLPPLNLSAIAQAVSLQQFWLDLSESERRFYFREFMQKIEIIRSCFDYKHWQVNLVFIFNSHQTS